MEEVELRLRLTSIGVLLFVALVMPSHALDREQWSWSHVKLHFDAMEHTPAVELRESGARYTLRDSPHSVIAKLEEAYEALDLAAYMDCLSDTLVARPDPEDLASNPGWPSSWGLALEQSAHETMFGPLGDVSSISVTLTEKHAPVEIPGASSGRLSSWLLYYNYDVLVFTNGIWTYWGNAGLELKISVDPHDSGPQGETLWEIAVWQDRASIESAVQWTTWGRVKALYR